MKKYINNNNIGSLIKLYIYQDDTIMKIKEKIFIECQNKIKKNIQ